jgi:hypothetical protein
MPKEKNTGTYIQEAVFIFGGSIGRALQKYLPSCHALLREVFICFFQLRVIIQEGGEF